MPHVNFVGWALEQDLGAFWGMGRCPRWPRHCNLHGCLYSSSNIFTMLHFSFSFISPMLCNWFTDFNFISFLFFLYLFVSGLDLLKYPCVRILLLKFIVLVKPFIMGSINFLTLIYIVKIEASRLEGMRFCQVYIKSCFFFF